MNVLRWQWFNVRSHYLTLGKHFSSLHDPDIRIMTGTWESKKAYAYHAPDPALVLSWNCHVQYWMCLTRCRWSSEDSRLEQMIVALPGMTSFRRGIRRVCGDSHKLTVHDEKEKKLYHFHSELVTLSWVMKHEFQWTFAICCLRTRKK